MSAHGATESFEIERKYAVGERSAWPGAEALAEIGLEAGAETTFALEATYFDTPDGVLGRQRVAVRLRRGGPDEGWHLKDKGDDGVRELQWPLAERMPQGLRDAIVDRGGPGADERLVAVATLRTVRRALRLQPVGAEPGAWQVELVDDAVEAENGLTGGAGSWREWEAELAPDAAESVLDLLEPLLIAAGGERVRGTSKVQRALTL